MFMHLAKVSKEIQNAFQLYMQYLRIVPHFNVRLKYLLIKFLDKDTNLNNTNHFGCNDYIHLQNSIQKQESLLWLLN